MLDALRQALTTALRARDAVAVSALRSALAAVGNAEAVPVPDADGGDGAGGDAGGGEHVAGARVGLGAAEVERRVLSEGDVVALVRAEADERLEAAAQVEALGRPEVAERLRAEAAVLQRHLTAG